MANTEVTMHWVQANAADFNGTPPRPRSGHSAVRVGKSMVVIFGGLLDKRFLSDIVVFDTENRLWFEPECTGNESDGQVGPCPRAFHVAVAIDCHMFVFGGRSGRKRLGDFWMLDTDIWQWTELSSYGDLPPARDFAAGAAVGNRKLVMYGGWDGTKWLSDVYVLDTMSLEWIQLPIMGSSPPPRCGHTATMVEKRLLIFGGRGGGGPIMGDLWALKGLFEEENESPTWTQLKLPGQAPAPRCGHTITYGGNQLLVFGGHGTGGWLTRYDIYYNDCIILDRASVQWKRLTVSNEHPPARAYHSMTRIGSRFLLFGGYDGKSTFGDIWWLVHEDDPMAKTAPLSSERSFSATEATMQTRDSQAVNAKGIDHEVASPLGELRRQLGLPAVTASASEFDILDESMDVEYLSLASTLVPNDPDKTTEPGILVKALQEYWKNSSAKSLRLRELGPLLRDYHRLISRLQCHGILEPAALHNKANNSATQMHRFYHLKNANQLRMDDIPHLLNEYKQLLQLSMVSIQSYHDQGF
uniref:Uncharacterized protein n=1 Tax=Araucaria cunninghamii TaxID=56994 RepID=A0A0D6QRX5_ARACU